MNKILHVSLALCATINIYCQENNESKTKLTNFLSKSYYSINFGGIFYPFSNENLIDGYKT
jgi:hypothetical protein